MVMDVFTKNKMNGLLRVPNRIVCEPSNLSEDMELSFT